MLGDSLWRIIDETGSSGSVLVGAEAFALLEDGEKGESIFVERGEECFCVSLNI